MTPRTSRISPHAESPHTTLDHLAALTNCRISSGYLRIPCPAHDGTNSNLALWVNGDGIAARCHSAGCSYADIAKAIEDRYGISINPKRYHDNPTALAPRPTNARRTPGPGPNAQDLRPHAINLWRRSVPIPKSSEHPARQWLANRHLWRPELPLPAPVRWIGAEHLRREFQGAGAIIAMAAPPSAWLTSWPSLPELSSVHLVYVAGDGRPAMDRGLTKRTYAAVQDAVVVLGCPLLEQTTAPVEVAEGLADALALAARSPAPAVATLGTSGMSSAIIAGWLEKRLAEEVSTVTAYMLALPEAKSSVEGLKADLKKGGGRLHIVDTTASAWGDGKDSAPRRDWESSRLGASPPEALGKLRSDVKNDIFGAFGIPSSIHGTGGSARESYRQFLASTILPLAKMVLEELALKLDMPTLKLDFSELRAADIATRARAFKQLVDAGMDKAEAMAKAGLD